MREGRIDETEQAAIEPVEGRCDEECHCWGSEGFLLARYEDLRGDTAGNLGKIAEFLNVEATEDSLSKAVSLASADRRHELEKAQAHLWRPLRKAHRDIDLVQPAASPSPTKRIKLSEEARAKIRARWQDRMAELGY